MLLLLMLSIVPMDSLSVGIISHPNPWCSCQFPVADPAKRSKAKKDRPIVMASVGDTAEFGYKMQVVSRSAMGGSQLVHMWSKTEGVCASEWSKSHERPSQTQRCWGKFVSFSWYLLTHCASTIFPFQVNELGNHVTMIDVPFSPPVWCCVLPVRFRPPQAHEPDASVRLESGQLDTSATMGLNLLSYDAS